MQISDKILLIASLIGACGVIIGAIKKLIKPIRDELKTIDELKRHTEENYLNILRLTVTSEEVPIEERLIAGDKYIQAGGNGAVKAYYHKLQEDYEKELSK